MAHNWAVDYSVLNDRPFDLPKPPTPPHEPMEDVFWPEQVVESLPVDIPNDADLNRRAIVAFIANPSDASDIKYEITVNGTSIRTGHFIGGVQRALWEVVRGGLFQAGANTITFTLTDVRRGTVSFSDVILWYKRTLPAHS